jgi:hypothetical protein
LVVRREWGKGNFVRTEPKAVSAAKRILRQFIEEPGYEEHRDHPDM